ncbi:MAG: NUDIX domain-containing protein [Rhodobiaceae bacterium]|nr:NUDIX domain-containing protein [Rhodobiaceae bacterium]
MDNVGLTHRIVVKAQIWRDGRLLIIKRAPDSDPYPGLWDVPGGSLHKGESVDAGIRRETFEEVDLALSHIRPLTTWSTGVQEDLVIGLSFLATSETDMVTLSEEHTDFAWVAPDNVDDYTFPPNLAKEIKWVIAKDWHLF